MSSDLAGPGSIDEYTASLVEKLHEFQQQDRARIAAFQELAYRYAYISKKYQEDCLATSQWQDRLKEYQDRVRSLEICIASNPFVAILIDGDGMIFQDELIKAGEEGGRKAAGLLFSAIRNFVQLETRNIPTDVKIICRVYANVRGLSDVLVRVGLIDDNTVFEEFMRGFTRGKVLFDFVDVGPGKDRADEKISEQFKLYAGDYQCRQIFLGCSHDNGYARKLEENAMDEVFVQRVTLLEGVPFEKELLGLPFKSKHFPEIFRNTKLVDYSQPSSFQPRNGVTKSYSIYGGLPSRFPPPPSRQVSADGYLRSPRTPKLDPISRTPSASTLGSSDSPYLSAAKPVLNSWAALAAAPAPPPKKEEPTYKPAQREELVARNRDFQRVDPACRDYDKTEVDRVKKLKLCNVHYLRQECPYGNDCTHSHAYKPTKEELNTLKLVARMAPCLYGTACKDVRCIYGHCCPAPRSKNAVKGTKTCIFGEQCKFPVELHDIDRNVVRTLLPLPKCINDLIGLQI